MHRPGTLPDAVKILADNADDVRLLAGGQSLVPLLNFRLATPAVIVDLNKITELAGIRRDGAVLRIGAMTRQQDILESPLIGEAAPLLQKAATHVGHLQTRSRGTLGGSIAQADPSAELPLALTALDATLTITSVRGARRLPIRSFFRHAMVTDLEPDEILTEIAVPIAEPGQRYAFREFARRHGDFAIVAAAMVVGPEGSTAALGGIEPTPRLCPAIAATLLTGSAAADERDKAIDADLAGAEPNADIQASADFRRHLARVLIHDCVNEIFSS
jgi:carbon-monoxide dehydrogenase medium subunit/2-furoyl-CoA dehydrogenase FAD binding subunit